MRRDARRELLERQEIVYHVFLLLAGEVQRVAHRHAEGRLGGTGKNLCDAPCLMVR